MADTSTPTADTSACLDGDADRPSSECHDESCTSATTANISACICDGKDHSFGECHDESCCDPATLCHSADEISYYRDKGMHFWDGDWCYTGGSVYMGKGTGVVFED